MATETGNAGRANPAAIALNRFGLGARPDDQPPADPHAWLVAQFDRYQPLPAAWSSQQTSTAIAQEAAQQRMQATQNAGGFNANPGNNAGLPRNPAAAQNAANNGANSAASDPVANARRAVNMMLRREARDTYREAVDARIVSALDTPAPFVERLVHFWANHFAVSVDKGPVAGFAGAFEMEAIRPHVLGRFEDMLVAVEQHPAMQLFLDQTRSVGPDSMAAIRAAERNPDVKRGLNENLAREIMELHTLGVRTGYTQQDVTEFARAMTGWSIANALGRRPDLGPPGTFMFRPNLHEPGARTILGRTYDEPGEGQARAVLHDLAASPATANHLATKLARHFIADNPPQSAVDRLAAAYTKSNGDLPTVYRALIDAPEAWAPADVKFKTPWEWTVSAMRGLGWRDLGGMQGAPLLTQLGQPVWRPGSPAGYDDIAASWAAPDALVRRVEVAQRLAARSGEGLDPRTLGGSMFAGSLSAPTATAVARAESTTTALALLIVSPDFQRR